MKNHQPPKLANQFLEWILKTDLVEEVLGDLAEKFDRQLNKKSPFKAKANYWYQILNYCRPFAVRNNLITDLNPFFMWTHNLKLAFRNSIRDKSTFLINLIGLSTGLAGVILIALWVYDEWRFDKFHEYGDRLYQVMENQNYDGEIFTLGHSAGLLAEAITAEIPEVEQAIAVTAPRAESNTILQVKAEKIKTQGSFVGKNYFEVFSFKLLQGVKHQLFNNVNSIVITEAVALKLFKTTNNVIGRSIQMKKGEEEQLFAVSGIYETPPSNSTLRFDYLLPIELYKSREADEFDWGNRILYTYAIIEESANIAQVNQKISQLQNAKEDIEDAELFLQKYEDRYLYERFENGQQAGGRITYVNLFIAIILFILLIACINFMNLSTAKATKRLKEIGVKKAIGGTRQSLIEQYLSESILLSSIGLITALGMVYLLLPQFNEITGKQLMLSLTPSMILSLIGVTLLTGLLAGSYPALFLSSFNPVAILKGKVNRSIGELWVRKGLVVFQFVVSIVLIIAVMIIYQQIDFVQNKHLGYDKENILYFRPEGKIAETVPTVLEVLKQTPGIKNASTISRLLVESTQRTSAIAWPGKTKDVLFDAIFVNYDLVETMGLEMAAGRSYSKDFGNEMQHIVLNEAAIEVMGLEDPIGKKIQLWEPDNYLTIIGVIKDFHFESLHKKIQPMFMELDAEDVAFIMAKIEKGKEQQAIGALQKFHSAYNPGYTFEYHFLDKAYEAQYRSEMRIGILAKYFAGLAILISCLGLFGLSAFTAERRQKEISIRKVLGASPLSIIRLLSGDFSKMVVVAIVLAIPLSYWLAQEWLNDFAFQITIQPWYFMAAGSAALGIAWLTVSMQTIRAALANPVKALKSE